MKICLFLCFSMFYLHKFAYYIRDGKKKKKKRNKIKNKKKITWGKVKEFVSFQTNFIKCLIKLYFQTEMNQIHRPYLID
jgi:hypothetical protein